MEQRLRCASLPVSLLFLLRIALANGTPAGQIPPIRRSPTFPLTRNLSKNNIFAPKQQQGTILTGYGSRTQFASSVVVSKTVVTIMENQRQVQHEIEACRFDARLFIRHRESGDEQSLEVYSNVHDTNITVYVDSQAKLQVEEVQNPRKRSMPNSFLHKHWTPVSSLYGVYSLPSGTVFVWIVDSELIYEPLSIHRITEMHMSKVSNDNNITQSQKTEEQRQLKLLRRALKDHDWFICDSNNLLNDMTRSLQATHTFRKQNSRWTPDDSFFWNADLLSPLNHVGKDSILLKHTMAVTSAFCSVQHQPGYDQILISRRSKFRAGTRFTKRGIDETGAVANGVETEQVVAVNNATVFASHIQTRGSLPLFWSSPTDIKTYRPRVRIGTDPIAQARALLAHLQDHRFRYVSEQSNKTKNHSSILVINLIDKKSDQGRLGRAFDAVLNAVLDVFNATVTGVEHVWWDFHQNVRSGKWDKLVTLLNGVEPTLQQQGYFLINRTTGVVERVQDGVIRTNCMDCLDRTNVCQGLFARYVLFHQLKDLGLTDRLEEKRFQEDQMSLPTPPMEQAHRLLWADNADSISRLYAGTAALKGDFTRTGKRTKKGALDDGVNSLQRYYRNNFLDADRQEGIDLMTGRRPFGSMDEEVTNAAGAQASAANVLANSNNELTVHEAVRKIFLGLDKNPGPYTDQNHVHINVKGGATSRKTKWGLGWLPGDLQSQVSSLNSRELETVDQRASSSSPWWIGDDGDDCEDSFRKNSPSRFNVNISRPGLMTAALLTSIHSPLAVATVAVGLIASASFREARVEEPEKDKD